jgi:cell division protein FtsB
MRAPGVALERRQRAPDAEATPAETPIRPKRRLRRRRLPSTRGGLAWLAVLVVLGGFLAIQIGREVYANWAIRQRAEELRREIGAVEAQNELLEDELSYLRSEAFVSAEARRLTNLGASGERVLIIPPGREQPLPPDLAPPAEPPKPMLEQWLDLFFGA